MRRLRSLIAGLPPEAAVWRDKDLWTRSDVLTAVVARETRDVVRMLHSMRPLRKGQQFKPMPPLQLLPSASPKPKAVSPAALARAMTGRH